MDANESLARGLYSRQLETLFEEFDRNHVLVLQYERCIQDPAAELRRTYDFLGVHPVGHVPEGLSERVGGAHPRMQLTDAVTKAARQMILRDTTKLEALVPEIDLSLWPSCRELAHAPASSVAGDIPSV